MLQKNLETLCLKPCKNHVNEKGGLYETCKKKHVNEKSEPVSVKHVKTM